MVTIDNLQLSVVIEEGNVLDAPLGNGSKLAVYLEAATAINTRRAYQGDLADFYRWGGELPASAEMLAHYVADRALCHSPFTVARRVVGIRRAHAALGFADPGRNSLVSTVLRGVRRVHGSPQRRARPLLKADLLEMLERVSGPSAVRDRALVLFGFAAALRSSELVSVDVEDLTFSTDGILLHLRRSKTDQAGEGRLIAIPYGRTAACPVTAITSWLLHSGIDSGALFRGVSKGGGVGGRLGQQSVGLIVKRVAQRLGIPKADVSGHSLRAGFVTSAAQSGVPLHKIQQQTGHNSLAMLFRYVRDSRLFIDNACAGIL